VDLPATAGTHEPPELLLNGPSLLRRLLLEGTERSKLALRIDDLFHGPGAERADQLVLQVCDADVETESFHLGATEAAAEPGPLETAPEVALLCGVTESRQSDVKPVRAEQHQEAPDGRRTSHLHNGDALIVKLPTTARSERFERELIADPFNEHDGTGMNAGGERLCCRGNHWTTATVTSYPIAGCQVGSLLLVHLP
jgi:hypothetical protein